MADLGYFRIEQGMLSRGAGAKAGASAAYQAGGGLTIGADLREAWAAKGQDPVSAVADFTGKSGVHHTDIRVPAGAPAWCADRQTLWTRVELSERRRDATLALQYTLSLSRGECQEFRVWPGILRKKETSNGSSQTACHTGRPAGPASGRRRSEERL